MRLQLALPNTPRHASNMRLRSNVLDPVTRDARISCGKSLRGAYRCTHIRSLFDESKAIAKQTKPSKRLICACSLAYPSRTPKIFEILDDKPCVIHIFTAVSLRLAIYSPGHGVSTS